MLDVFLCWLLTGVAADVGYLLLLLLFTYCCCCCLLTAVAVVDVVYSVLLMFTQHC